MTLDPRKWPGLEEQVIAENAATDQPTSATGRRISEMNAKADSHWEALMHPVDFDAAVASIERESRAAVLAIIEDHHPEIGSDISDSTWLECWCGWDSEAKGAVGWHRHLVDAVDKVLSPGD